MTTNSELRKIVKHITFMKMAANLSKLSYDPKHQVGSLIIKNDWTEINSMGYNGNYQGAPNKRDSLDSGKSNFIHAEMNALLLSTLSREEAEKYTIYVTMTPCETCSRLIVNKGIKNVIVLKHYQNCGDSLEVFKNANITFHYIHDLVKSMYIKTFLGDELNLIFEKFNIGDITIEELDTLLIECFTKQIKHFFEFSDKYKDSIPHYFVTKDVTSSYKVRSLYLEKFVNTLYELV